MCTPINEHQAFGAYKEIENTLNHTTCVICLENFIPEDEVTATKCHHIFHKQCLGQWQCSHSPKHAHCPLCLQVIITIDEESDSVSMWNEVFYICGSIFIYGIFVSIYQATKEH